MSVAVGIHDLSVATAAHVLDLDLLAAYQGVDPAKYHIGLGQDRMSVPGPDEDIVTMAAAAAQPIVERVGAENIRTLYLATESGVDQSKSAAVWVHRLLGLPASCRVVELKQACYAATAALQAALAQVARSPQDEVLVIGADIARYDLDSAAEATQGAGAVAMLVRADPGLVTIEPASGVFTAEVDDFWRPNGSSTAVVDGKLSVSAYLDAIVGAWDDYRARGGVDYDRIDRWCHHQPFTKMAVKAHRALAAHVGAEPDESQITASTGYNRQLGNSYTASLYLALAALLDEDDDLDGARIGFFSYGSGSVGELFAGVVSPGYRTLRRAEATRAALSARRPLSVAEYRELHANVHADDDGDRTVAPVSRGPFRFTGVEGRARRYTRA